MVAPSLGNTQRSDRTAISVIGVDQGGNKYLLDGVCHRMKLSDRWDYIKQLKRKWEGHPGVFMVKIGYERYGQQVDLEVIKDMMMRENNDFPIEELNTPREGRHAKSDRISRLEPDIREGRFYLPCVAYHGDFGKPGEHICYWSVIRWSEFLQNPARCNHRFALKTSVHSVHQARFGESGGTVSVPSQREDG